MKPNDRKLIITYRSNDGRKQRTITSKVDTDLPRLNGYKMISVSSLQCVKGLSANVS